MGRKTVMTWRGVNVKITRRESDGEAAISEKATIFW
jgi:hypothetical protein